MRSLLLLARVRGLLVVRLLDGVDELLLLHLRAAGDRQPLGDVEQVLLGGVGVDAALGLLARVPATGGLRVGGPLPAAGLLLPVVADLLEAVLDGGPGDLVRAALIAVLVDGRVVCLGIGALRLARRALERAGELALLRTP